MRTPISILACRLLPAAALLIGLTAAATRASAQELRDQYHSAPRDTVSQDTIAPHLIPSLKPEGAVNTKELFIQTVCAGRPAKGMPSWCALSMELPTIEKIYAYVKARSDAKLGPGRPALKPGT